MASLTPSQANTYWNVFRNTLSGVSASPDEVFSEDALFHLQADPRYIEYLTEYLRTAPDMLSGEKAALLRDVGASHDAAVAIVSDAPNPALSEMINRIFTAIENNDTATLGLLAHTPGYGNAVIASAATLGVDETPTGSIPDSDSVDTLPAVNNGPLHITVGGGTVVQWPVNGTIIKGFGEDLNGRPNDGVDIQVAMNTPVHATADGTVIFAGPNEIFGNLVIVKHNDMSYAAYGYLDEINVAKEDAVTRDQPLAIAGIPEGSTTPQLHFEMRMGPDNTAIDPVEMLGDITPAAPAAEFTNYAVQKGDSLWTIAKTHYNLTDDTDIANAVEHIANANDMTAGTMANHLRAPNPDDPDDVQIIKLPEATVLPTDPAIALDWKALHHETMTGEILRGDFSSIDGGNPILFSRESEGDEPSVTLGVRGSLTQTAKEAASQFGITLTNTQAYALTARVAQENGIENPDVVDAGQPVRFTRDMFGGSQPS